MPITYSKPRFIEGKKWRTYPITKDLETGTQVIKIGSGQDIDIDVSKKYITGIFIDLTTYTGNKLTKLWVRDSEKIHDIIIDIDYPFNFETWNTALKLDFKDALLYIPQNSWLEIEFSISNACKALIILELLT